ncbi:MAG: hypothetical protein LBQ18_03555 [Campylobacteraceae bacterium]|jgi:uncharacterized membrane protein|nr:hypothetical protein [Campylobacteraceae bacterium]
MRFLLVNTNPAVSKLVSASLNRIGHETKEVNGYDDLPLDSFIAVIVDSDSYDHSHIDDLLAVSIAPSLIYLKQQDAPTPIGFQYALSKPFLPTDFISFIVSILKKNPELKRFITPQAEEFVAMLPEESRVEAEETPAPIPEQNGENGFINFNFYDDLQKKEPIFGVSEETAPTEPIDMAFSAPKIEPDSADNVSFNLSDDIGKLYSTDESAQEEANDIQEEIAAPTAAPIQEGAESISESLPPVIQESADVQSVSEPVPPTIQESEDIQIEESVANNIEDSAANSEEFTFDINSVQESAAEAELPAVESEKADESVDFDFDIMDAAPTQEADLPADEPAPIEEETKKFDGFGDLAKEFDDLIKAPQADENSSEDAKLPPYATEQKTDLSPQETPKANPFESISEKDMRKALQDSGFLPKAAEDLVKSEIQSVVQNSVQGVLQSQILRDVLKGLKMNITITFEDKD